MAFAVCVMPVHFEMLKHADPVHKVTIIPRGRALGLTQSLPAEDRLTKLERELGELRSELAGLRQALGED